jgi:membrane protein implicated in regulation of membrane protease activity
VALVGAILLAIFILPPAWRIPVVLAGGAIEVGESIFWIWLSKRRRPSVGVETLVGARAIVVTPCRPLGQVRVQGELWQARCDEGADPGDNVTVDAVEGLTLIVAPLSAVRTSGYPA